MGEKPREIPDEINIGKDPLRKVSDEINFGKNPLKEKPNEQTTLEEEVL